MSQVVVDRSPFLIRAGLVIQDSVVALAYADPGKPHHLRGMIASAKVAVVDARLGAAFLEVAGSDPGFLRRRGKLPAVGASFPVEVKREPVGGKGADVSDRPVLRLPGVTWPVSGDASPGPAGDGRSTDAFANWSEQLVAQGDWDAIPLSSVLVSQLMDSETTNVHFIDAMPDAVDALALTPLSVSGGPDALLSAALDEAEERALMRIYGLPGGGRMVVDETEALVAIDLDLGKGAGQSEKGAASRLLGEALSALGGQARLAGLGGQIVIDVPRAAIASPKIIRDRLTRALRPLGRVAVPAVTPEGVCVVIAPKHGPSTLERLTEETNTGVRPGRRFRDHIVADQAYRALRQRLQEDLSARTTLALSPRVAKVYDREPDALAGLAARVGGRFEVVDDPKLEDCEVEFDVR